MRRNSFFLAAVVTAVLTGGLFAEEDKPGAPALFKNLDKNGDGKLVADEVPADKRVFYERLLKTSDKDGDGVVTAREFNEGFAKRGRANRSDRRDGEKNRQRRRAGQNRPEGARGAQNFKRLDKNGDGKITRDEMPERMRARFDAMVKRADQDGDGALSGREFAGMTAAGRAQSPGSRNRSAARRPSGQTRGIFALLDTDGDGKLTKAELKKAPKLISRLDKDGDQALSAREIAAAPRASAKEGKGKAKRKQARRERKKGEGKKKKGEGKKKNSGKKKEKKAEGDTPKVRKL